MATDDWTPESLRELAVAFMPSAAFLAAAELGVFGLLAAGPSSASELAARLRADRRAMTILADALVNLGLLHKHDGLYSADPEIVEALSQGTEATLLPYARHHANSLKAWARLAEVVQSGRPASVEPSIRGADADHSAYIATMEVVGRQAPEVIAALGPPQFEHLLDVGCGPATWAIAFLRGVPGSRATLFDLPEVLPIAREHVEDAGLDDRVTFVSGNFRTDEFLPAGVDMVWLGAAAHLNSRQQNRELFAKIHAALQPGGHLLIRDVVMNDAHTEPRFGAMFAVLMLVRTEAGGTFSFEEFREDLLAAGFDDVELLSQKPDMDSIVRARKALSLDL
jgi:SAM-dependent methyltransferase